MVDHLGEEFQFRVLALDRDAVDELPYPEVKTNGWNRLGNADVYYVSPGNIGLAWLRTFLRGESHDLLYINGYFNPRFTGLPLLARATFGNYSKPTLLAPRGVFSPGAMALKSFKKSLYIHTTRMVRLYREVAWQASTSDEHADIQRIMGKSAEQVYVARDLPPRILSTIEEQVSRRRRPSEKELRIVFLSRIAEMKNLAFAIHVLSKVRSRCRFLIYGPIFDEKYWRHCQGLMSELPAHITVEYGGVVTPENVRQVFSEHDVFLFPTFGENYGHVIFESLSAGTPVIVSDQTPWKDDAAGACRALPLDESAFVAAIEAFAGLDAKNRLALAGRAVEYAGLVLRDDGVVDANREMFNSLLQL